MSGAPQVGFAGQAPDQPHDPGAEVQGGVINTNEDVKVDVPLSANHNDGTIGCEELDFSTSNWTNGTVGAITDRPCNTTELAADVTDIGVYDPTASEDSAGADTCSDGIDNDSDGIDAADPDDCRLLIIPIVSIGGLNKGAGVVQIGDELISYTSSAPAGDAACGGDDTKGSGPACLTGITRGDFKTTCRRQRYLPLRARRRLRYHQPRQHHYYGDEPGQG
ncbi:MAG: hypothetical protein IH958_05965 [Chloroflexi bacterium]|nr:hypothetical protein [Chloroflexota bacterium]